jgi:ribosome-associated heat shock protein Hsp15
VTVERHRIDHWLKLVCLFKHREEAAEACRGGHVKINDQRVKASAAVKENDVVEFLKDDRFRRVIAVVLPDAQLSKEAGRTAYIDESPEPPQQPKASESFRDRGTGRPTKKERREIEKFKR